MLIPYFVWYLVSRFLSLLQGYLAHLTEQNLFVQVSSCVPALPDVETTGGSFPLTSMKKYLSYSEYITWKWVEGLHDGSSETIYIPTEANLPILEANRRK